MRAELRIREGGKVPILYAAAARLPSVPKLVHLRLNFYSYTLHCTVQSLKKKEKNPSLFHQDGMSLN